MKGSSPDIRSVVLDSLSDEERRSAVAYLDERIVEAGDVVLIDGREVAASGPVMVAFVDREPGANWAHDCRYLLVRTDTGDVESVAGRFPPFLRGTPATLRVIHRPAGVPDWAIHPTD